MDLDRNDRISHRDTRIIFAYLLQIETNTLDRKGQIGAHIGFIRAWEEKGAGCAETR